MREAPKKAFVLFVLKGRTLEAQNYRSRILKESVRKCLMKVMDNISWEMISWPLVKNRIRRLQRRIYEASKNGDKRRMYFLQNILINSKDAKLLAVLQVTTLNKGRKSSYPEGPEKIEKILGVDQYVPTTAKEKLSIGKSLSFNGKAQPIRPFWIEKPEKSGRRRIPPLGIPTIRDRAKQAVGKLALEPQWEARFEPNSYGFRPGRSAHDACEAISQNLCLSTNKWVYDTDIRKCFGTISHEGLIKKLDTFPTMETQVNAWLKSGIMEGYMHTTKDCTDRDVGTPTIFSCGILSPLLANVALHGLLDHLHLFAKTIKGKVREPFPTKKILYPSKSSTKADPQGLGVVRYAEFLVLMHGNKQILERCIGEIKNFLSLVKLDMIEEKPVVSLIKDGREGFQFLGFQIIQLFRKKEYSCKIYPSREKVALFLLKVRGIIQSSKAVSSYDLVERLKPVIIGWAQYFQYCECSQTFTKLNHLIFEKLRAWAFRRDKRNNRAAVKEKYFPTGKTYSYQGVVHSDNWVLNGQKKTRFGVKTNFLPNISWVPRKTFTKKGYESRAKQKRLFISSV